MVREDESKEDIQEKVFEKAVPPYFAAHNKLMHSSFKRAHSEKAYKEVARIDEEAWLAAKNKNWKTAPLEGLTRLS